MLREIDFNEISDGKRYLSGDMVKVGCNGCQGCSTCCRVVDDTIILDPYDLFQLEKKLKKSFEELLSEHLELSVYEGLIQPHLKLREKEQGCTFLQEDGRCEIHDARPGFCRMFPLGRIYEGEDFRYFIQVKECVYPEKARTKVKLKKWLGIPDLQRYEQFVKDWHSLIKGLSEQLLQLENQELVKSINMYVLNQFYVKGYESDDFYGEFYARLEESRRAL